MYGAEKTGVTLMPNGILVLGPPKRS
jgi:hypothetical protein